MDMWLTGNILKNIYFYISDEIFTTLVDTWTDSCTIYNR